MIPDFHSDQQLAKETMCQSDTDFLDRVWAYFLHDYENMDDDKFSVRSHDETVSNDGGVSHTLSKEYDESRYMEGEDYSRYSDHEDESKYTGVEDHTRYTSREDESKHTDLEDYTRYSLPEEGDMVLDASLQRTLELLEYARKLESSKKKAAKERRAIFGRDTEVQRRHIDQIPENREYDLQDHAETKERRAIFGRDVEVTRKRIDQIPENREYDLQDNVDTNSPRVGPPQMIYVQNDAYGVIGNDDVLPSQVDDSIDQRLSFDYEKEENTEPSTPSNDSNKIEEIIAKRKELYRRIALLRIKAAKVRMAKADP